MNFIKKVAVVAAFFISINFGFIRNMPIKAFHRQIMN